MSGSSEIYQRRLIGFTIETRVLTVTDVGDKECREAEESNCCLPESGSGSSGGSGGSSEPVGEQIVDLGCIKLYSTIMRTEFGGFLSTLGIQFIVWNGVDRWVLELEEEGFDDFGVDAIEIYCSAVEIHKISKIEILQALDTGENCMFKIILFEKNGGSGLHEAVIWNPSNDGLVPTGYAYADTSIPFLWTGEEFRYSDDDFPCIADVGTVEITEAL